MRRIVEAHGGEVAAESEPGHGSTFTVTLPLPERQPRPADPTEPPAEDEPQQMRVLVADDDPTTLQLLRVVLGRAGHEVTTAVNAQEAVALADRAPPDLVLMDVEMPGEGCVSTAAALRAAGAGRVIAVTGHSAAELKLLYPALNVDQVITKPLRMEPLVRELRQSKERR